MFATLRYHPQSSMSEVGKSVPRRASVSISRLACVSCRQKKLRCSGGDPACERCAHKGLECTYPKRAARAKTKKTTTTPKESVAAGKNASNSPVSPPNQPEPRHSHNKAPGDTTEPHPDAMEVTTSRPCSVEPHNPFLAHGDPQLFNTPSPMDGCLDYDLQLPTPVSSSINSIKGSRPASIVAEEMSADMISPLDKLMPPGFDPGNCISPTLAAMSWCDDWLDLDSADAQLKTDEPPPPTLTRCNCVQLAVKTIEEAAAWAEMDDLLLAHSALAAYKEYLSQCEAGLSCTRCSSPSSMIMLVLVITDKLITSFRRIHNFSQSLIGAATSMDETGPLPCTSLAGGFEDAQQDRRIFLGEYPIESSGEWSRVVNVLLSSQLLRLSRLFMKVWARLNTLKEESQVQIIKQQEERLRAFITHFERSAPFSVC